MSSLTNIRQPRISFALAFYLLILVLCLPANSQEFGELWVTDREGDRAKLYGGSHALLIGVSDYEHWNDLRSVPTELDSVADVLKSQGFAIERCDDPDADELEDCFETFIEQHGYNAENRLVFFFAGHGHTWADEDRGYLVPRDAPKPIRDEGDPGASFSRKALQISQIVEWSRQMSAKHALFLFDSCFSGIIFETRGAESEPEPEPFFRLNDAGRKTRQFITAGSVGEKVPATSVFTPAFVEALEHRKADVNRDGYVTGKELGLHLQQLVPRFAKQTPQFGGHPRFDLSRGDFVFAVGGGLRTIAAAVPTDTEPTRSGMPQLATPTPANNEAAIGLNFNDRIGVQEALTTLGHDTTGIDGQFGPRTRTAIASWQEARGDDATGYLTSEQYDGLRSDAQRRIAQASVIRRQPDELQVEEPGREQPERASPSNLKVIAKMVTSIAYPGEYKDSKRKSTRKKYKFNNWLPMDPAESPIRLRRESLISGNLAFIADNTGIDAESSLAVFENGGELVLIQHSRLPIFGHDWVYEYPPASRRHYQYFTDRTFTVDDKGSYRIGSLFGGFHINYEIVSVTSDRRSCLTFVSVRGNTRIEGFFCRHSSQPIVKAESERLFGQISIKGVPGLS